jgi:hypothetical protein
MLRAQPNPYLYSGSRGSTRGQRHKGLGMSRFRRTVRGIIRRDLPLPGRSIEHVDGAIEERERGQRLIVGHLMPRFVDTCEAEIAVFARLAVFDAIDHHGRIACGAELLGAGEVGGQTDGFTAEPVADVICCGRVKKQEFEDARMGEEGSGPYLHRRRSG